jgi:hypothetical protein
MSSLQKIISSEKQKYSFGDRDVMRLCRVVRKSLKTTSYELFDSKSGLFILSCTTNNDLNGDWIFTTLQSTHLRELKDIPISNYSSSFLGLLKRNYLGMIYSLYNDHDMILAKFRYLFDKISLF